MRRLIALICLACVSCGPIPAAAVELDGDRVSVTQEERHKLTECHRQGGCFVVTKAEIVALLQEVQRRTIEVAADVAAKEISDAAKSCRRGSV